MARTLDDLYEFARYIVKKERGVFLTTDEFTSMLDNGQMDLLEQVFSLYGKDQIIHDSLRPFRVYYQFTSDSSGFVTFPEGYLHIIGAAFTVAGSTVNEINFYNEDEFVKAITSQLRVVSNSNPIAKDTATGFSIYPQQSQIGFFNYITRPVTPIYVATYVGRQVIYDSVNSVNLQWSDAYLNNIVAKALKYIGINMSEQEVYGFADQYNAETKPK